MSRIGKIFIVSTGPGDIDWIPAPAIAAIQKATVLVGYQTYLDQIATLCPKTPREATAMRHEVSRAERAIQLALKGEIVAVISGGDAGIYGMAGLILEKIALFPHGDEIPVEILPGISALNAAASQLGAPLMSDFAAISLSDYLVPLETILARVESAVRAGFILCLYNPCSHCRKTPYEKTIEILAHTLPPETPVGIVVNALRPTQKASCITLDELPAQEINMNTILIIGNQTTKIIQRRMVTPRGYPIHE